MTRDLKSRSGAPTIDRRQRCLAVLAGAWLMVVVVKFVNPVVLYALSPAPANALEWVVQPWPITWGFALTAVLALASIGSWRRPPAMPHWLVWLPLLWLAVQLCSALQTEDALLTRVTLMHFAFSAGCFFLGVFALGRVPLTPVLVGAAGGMVIALGVGWDQHFGGLEETRRFFAGLREEDYPAELRAHLRMPEFRHRIASDRIWGTFFYPNALAGGILLLVPAGAAGLWRLTARGPAWLSVGLVSGFVMLGLACLYWSGSKAGWLIALAMVAAVLVHLPGPRRLKVGLAVAAVVLGGSVFAMKYAGYFGRGAPSAGARLDYWRAAVKIMAAEPWLGTGPGTFQRGYARLKQPEAEMTRLVHNDYLQQGCDAGIPALVLYAAWVFGAVGALYGRGRTFSVEQRWVWLGCAAFAVQSLVEFPLYQPALAWPFFLLLGALWGTFPRPTGGEGMAPDGR